MHSYYLQKASLRLAKERGCEWINKRNTPEVWLPIDAKIKQLEVKSVVVRLGIST